MKRFLKIIAIAIVVIVVGLIGFIIYVTQFLPKIESPDLQVKITPERVERGKYLANEVMGCTGCHAQRNYTKFAWPIIEESKGIGGEIWNEKMQFQATMYAPNITPFAIINWSDVQLFRAITAGVDKEGDAL